MYQFSSFVFVALCTLLQQIASEIVLQHEPISFKFDDLYSQCSQFGGSKLCLGAVTRENEKHKLPKSDCVRSKSCVLLFQFFAVDSKVGEHCLFFSREYRDRVKKENGRKMDIIALLGVRFGYEPVAPTLESTCFLGDSTDFLQIYYPDKRLNLERIKSGPAFDNDDGQAYVRYDNIPENEGDQIYCCFRQPLRLKIMNTTNFRAEPNEVVLDKEVYLSLYYLIGDHNNTLKLTQPFNLVEFKEKPESTSTTTPPTTTTTESSPKPNNSSSDSPGTSTSDSPRPTDDSATEQPPVIIVDSIKSEEDKKQAGAKAEAGSGRVLIIFALSIVLLAFFLLIALSIYNLLMK